MKSLISRLSAEWERTVLAVVCSVFVCFLFAWLLPGRDEGNKLSRATLRQPPSALGTDACAFLDPTQAQDTPTGDAFAFAYEAPPPTPTASVPQPDPTPPEKVDQTPDGTGPGGGNTELGNTQPDGGTGTKDTGVPPRRNVRALRYLGTYEGATGRRLAALAVRNPDTGRTRTLFLSRGETCEGIRIDAFDPAAVHVLVPGGAHATVERGGERTVDMN